MAITIAGVALGLVLILYWRHVDAAVVGDDVTGLQAGVQAGDMATVRWPSWTPEPTSTKRVYPSWTPEPTRTSRVYPSWTPRIYPTWTPETPVDTPTPIPQPSKPCNGPWPFTYNERQNIMAAALNHLWLEGRREEPLTVPQEDVILSIGLYALDLGAPLTSEFRIFGDTGGRIRIRGFASGIVAVAEWADGDLCRDWAVISWGGEPEADE